MGAKVNIYKTINGERVSLSARQIKNTIMKVNKWTSDEYNKNYDILRNKLRAFEKYESLRGRVVEKQSPMKLLYFEAKAKQREGTDYKPSLKLQRIRSFSSISSGKALEKASKSERYISVTESKYSKFTYKQFEGLIKNNEDARKIFDSIKDPVKREQALTAYADKLHAVMDAQSKVIKGQKIPFGETYGSTDMIPFDIEDYM